MTEITVDLDLLFKILGIIIIPIIGVFIRMFLQMRKNEHKIEAIEGLIGDTKELAKKVTAIENELSGLRETIKGLADVLGRTRDYVLKNKDDIDDLIKRKK